MFERESLWANAFDKVIIPASQAERIACPDEPSPL
jgi:hypothetical protein